MKVGDLVKIDTRSLHFLEGKYAIIMSCWMEDSMLLGEVRWYNILVEGTVYCFKHRDLEMVNEGG